MSQTLTTDCCIAGGGPAGMMLGLLLARAGIDTLVLEKHADFLRDFRGDTIHPSTLDALEELGMLDEVLARPHSKATEVRGNFGKESVVIGNFSGMKLRSPFIAFMPQWDFLDALSSRAKRYPTFALRMKTEAKELLFENDRVAGLKAFSTEGEIEIRAALTVAADGRHSILRGQAGLEVIDLGAPIDVLWMRLSRQPGDPRNPQGYFQRGHLFVMLDRGDYWQCACVIQKGGLRKIQAQGLPALLANIAESAPLVKDRLHELRSWEDIKLLTVSVDRLRKWHRPGFLCIGDAAHAMSPVGGVGINLAIQDAIAAANILAQPLANGTLTDADLARLQKRREFPTKLIQRAQVMVQNNILKPVLEGKEGGALTVPWLLRLSQRFPVLQKIPAYMIGIGPRPEHVKSRDAFAK